MDASLWFSRAYDDAEYDEAPAAELDVPSVTLEHASAQNHMLLIVLVKNRANMLSRAYKAEPMQTIGSIGDCKIFSVSEGVALIGVPDGSVPDEASYAWAQSIMDALNPRRVICLTSSPQHFFMHSNDDVHPLLALGSPHPSVNAQQMDPPALLDGIAAAVLSEATFRRPENGLCAYIECSQSVGFFKDTLLRLALVLDSEIGVHVSAEEALQRQQRLATQTRNANLASRTSSLYM